MRREPEVPEERVPVVECLDGPARITSKELAITHSVKNGTLQNACSTRPRVVVGLGKSAHSHIVRLVNNLVKRSKKNDDKSAVAILKKHEQHDRTGRPFVSTHQIHDNLVASFRIWSAEVFIDFTEELRHTENRSDV